MESVVYKTCIKCSNKKPLAEFHYKKGGKLDRRSDCAACVKIYQAKRRNGPKRQQILKEKRLYQKLHPEIKRNSHYKSMYGITLEEYNSKLESQQYVCAICRNPTPNSNQHKHLYVDHNHSTGKIRGLICNPCNNTIGYAKEDIARLLKCIEYLKKHA
jgi:Recombination endonuclease VII